MARGNEEEAMERAQRRSREQSLQQEFAASRVRVVDELGRAFATGDIIEHVCPTVINRFSFSLFHLTYMDICTIVFRQKN